MYLTAVRFTLSVGSSGCLLALARHLSHTDSQAGGGFPCVVRMRAFLSRIALSCCSLFVHLTAVRLILSLLGAHPCQASLTHRQPGRRRFHLSSAHARFLSLFALPLLLRYLSLYILLSFFLLCSIESQVPAPGIYYVSFDFSPAATIFTTFPAPFITFPLLCGQIFEDSVELQRIFIRARDELGENGKRLSSRAYEYTLTTMGRLPVLQVVRIRIDLIRNRIQRSVP
jgi:hypothetical protein